MATTHNQIELTENWQSLGDLLGGIDFSTHRALVQCDTHSVWAIAYSQVQPDTALRGACSACASRRSAGRIDVWATGVSSRESLGAGSRRSSGEVDCNNGRRVMRDFISSYDVYSGAHRPEMLRADSTGAWSEFFNDATRRYGYLLNNDGGYLLSDSGGAIMIDEAA